MTEALIYLGSEIASGEDKFKKVLLGLEDEDIKKISSIFRTQGEKNTHSRYDELSIVVLIRTKKSAPQLAYLLSSLSAPMKEKRTYKDFEQLLLIYGKEIRMTPELTLPFPELFSRPEILLPSAEIYGQYYHPILGKALAELASEIQSKQKVIFYKQNPFSNLEFREKSL